MTRTTYRDYMVSKLAATARELIVGIEEASTKSYEFDAITKLEDASRSAIKLLNSEPNPELVQPWIVDDGA